MRQLRFPGNDRALVDDGPEPQPSPGEVIGRAERCAPCRSGSKIQKAGQ